MRILILSFYYEPDLSAGSFRTTALVNKLKEYDDMELEVVTTLPNRYASYSSDASKFTSDKNVVIHRIELPKHSSGMIDQIRAFYVYYKQAQKLVKENKYGMVYATSSRLFTAFLGAKIAKKKNIPLYLDIRDIFADTLNDVLHPAVLIFLKPVLKYVENYTFSKANNINLVSKGFEDYFVNKYPDKKYSWFTNGIDNEFLSIREKSIQSNNIKTILYAGNIGEGQGLNTIVPKLAKKLSGHAEFVIIGDGGRKQLLLEELEKNSVDNVVILPPVNRKELLNWYNKADVLFLHLNDLKAFEKVIPSKLFEYASLNKPILAGVKGYSKKFISEEICGAEVFNPGSVSQAIDAYNRLRYDDINRHAFIKKYSRNNIMSDMARDIIGVSKSKVQI